MSIPQTKYMNFFIETTPSYNHNHFYNNSTTAIKTEPFQPTYNLNDVVYHHLTDKILPPAVRDDSGITFNNTLIPPPPPPPPSRKRSREVLLPSVSKVSRISGGYGFESGEMSLQIVQQQLELDRLISHHMETIRIEIEQIKKQQLKGIITTVEESNKTKLRQKDEELSKIGRINYALEEKIKSLYLENQIWRDIAQNNEATVTTLRANLAQALQQTTAYNNNLETADDAVSSCGEVEVEVEEDSKNEWVYRGKSGEDSKKRLCRKCGEGESSVLVLPCKHLCVCTVCGPTVNVCPVCDTVKNASVHVNLS